MTRVVLSSGELRWVFRWSVNGKPFERTHRTQAQAEEHQEQWLRERRVGAHDRAQGVLLTDFVEEVWLPQQRARFETGEIVWTTYKKFWTHWEVHLKPVFGMRWMHEITAPQIEDFLRAKLNGHTARGEELPLGKTEGHQKLAAKTTKDLLLDLGAIYTEARRRELLTTNPCERVSKAIVRGGEKEEVSAFSAQEVDGLLYQCPRRFRLIMELCLYTGMRISEVRGLTWGDVVDGKIRVNKTVKPGPNRHDEAGRTKGQKAHDITIGAELVELVDEQKEIITSRGFTTRPRDLIFPNTNKGFIGYGSLRAQVFLPAERTLRLQEGITDTERTDLLNRIRELARGTVAEPHADAYCLITRLLELPGAVLGRPRRGTEPSANEGILGTKHEDFNLRARTLRVRNYDGEPVTLPLDSELVALLTEHQRRTCLWSNQAGFIFIGRRGTALSALKYSALVLDRAMREVGLNTDRTIHVFRHTAATFLIDEGRSLVQVQQLLGHSRPSTTADIYSHAWRDAQEQKPQDAFSAYAAKYGRPGRK